MGIDSKRLIDPGTPPNRYARGWHCLGPADSFRDGRPHTVEAFGTKLVVWADRAGRLQVVDGYCRHMGGDLGQGTVKGDEIACPFHDWRWGGDGGCKEIPYARRVPMRAKTRTWHAMERNRQLFVWHDHEGNPPIPEQMVPEIPELETGEWSAMTWQAIDIPGSNCREIIDNIVDMAHFFYIHGAFPTYFRNVFEGHVASQYMNSEARPDLVENGSLEESLLRSEAAYYGPSYMINPLTTTWRGFDIDVILVNCHYPVTQTDFRLQFGLMVRKVAGLDDDTAVKVAQKFTDLFAEGFLQDVWIWQNKSPIQNPLLCEEDGPVYQLRRWYDQFYVDVADITPEMTARFEFEVDTRKANEYWRAEVAGNLARQEAEAQATS
ncbi:Rieske 2Fe-2S domain-containing protein [Nocardioides pelophilus]|uniref:Rieske 2Fe-2S domain-containing protein n=1 Tax=Nocardioides pelophilus TaxID=2172019 RepID=UPI001602859B|nr:Rieske 2Fe-2S domain-containing protein [Nocardioides pelophilus]